jgi:hypothetical protein
LEAIQVTMALGDELKYLSTVLLLGTFAINIASFFREFLDKLLWTVLPMDERGTSSSGQMLLFLFLRFALVLSLFFALTLVVF